MDKIIGIVLMSIAGISYGLILGVPGSFFKHKRILHHYYYGLSTILFGPMLAFRYFTLNIIPLDVRGSASEQFPEGVAALVLTAGAFWLPSALGYDLGVLLIARIRGKQATRKVFYDH